MKRSVVFLLIILIFISIPLAIAQGNEENVNGEKQDKYKLK